MAMQSSKRMYTPTADDPLEWSSYRTLVKLAMSLGLPGNLKKEEYVELLTLHQLGFSDECKRLAGIMKIKRQKFKKSNTKNLVKKRSVGRPRKLKLKNELLSDTSSEDIPICASIIEKISDEKIKTRKPTKLLKLEPGISEVQTCTNSFEQIVYQPPITKTTNQLLRSMLLSSDRTKFNKSGTNTSSITSTNNSYFNYFQNDSSNPLNLEVPYKNPSFIENAYKAKWKNNIKNPNISTKDTNLSMSGSSFLPDLQAFPDIPQLADVDINASIEQDYAYFNKNDSNDQTDSDTTVLYIDDSDTLSNQSTENIEQLDIDQRWAMSIRMESDELTTPLDNCETIFDSHDDNSLIGLESTGFVQNGVIQSYVETNNVQFMQFPDSNYEIIRTLQYYDSSLTSSSSMPEQFQNCNESVFNVHTIQDEQTNIIGANRSLAEFTNMLPCPISGCLWYSHSATLYVHLFTCHHDMIYNGSLITHVFRCQDIQNFFFFTNLQYLHNIIYIITVTFDSYSHTFVATIQHVSSCGDNTNVSPTIATLTTVSFYDNIDQHSWTGQVQPYSIPLDVLHSDGRCLFIDPTNSEHVIISVNITVPSTNSGDLMLDCV